MIVSLIFIPIIFLFGISGFLYADKLDFSRKYVDIVEQKLSVQIPKDIEVVTMLQTEEKVTYVKILESKEEFNERLLEDERWINFQKYESYKMTVENSVWEEYLWDFNKGDLAKVINGEFQDFFAHPFLKIDDENAMAFPTEEFYMKTEEEMRVLYVAMTRARERLYITGKPRYGMKNVQKHTALATCPATSYFELQGNSYLEWILFALERVDHSEFCEVIKVRAQDLLTASEHNGAAAKASEDAKKAKDSTAEQQAARELFTKRFDFTYPAAHLSRLPAKLSVSRLTPRILDVYDKEAIGEEALHDPDVEALLHTFDRVPQFGKATHEECSDAKERGTATHEFLQFCDFKLANADLDKELERLPFTKIARHHSPPRSGTLF